MRQSLERKKHALPRVSPKKKIMGVLIAVFTFPKDHEVEIRLDLNHVTSKGCSDANEKPTDENHREPYFWLIIKIAY